MLTQAICRAAMFAAIIAFGFFYNHAVIPKDECHAVARDHDGNVFKSRGATLAFALEGLPNPDNFKEVQLVDCR